MEVHLKRQPSVNGHTLGVITIDGYRIHTPTIEDETRPLGVKVHSKTAIPCGRYKITLDVVSPKFSRYSFYMDACNGKLPRLLDVPMFSGILIHCGRNENQSSGCIILNDYNGSLEKSKHYFRELYAILLSAKDDIYITIE